MQNIFWRLPQCLNFQWYRRWRGGPWKREIRIVPHGSLLTGQVNLRRPVGPWQRGEVPTGLSGLYFDDEEYGSPGI
jgi:hypothetical protein